MPREKALIHESLMEKVKNAPKEPGCYLYKDYAGHIIYVGKAKKLHNRVRQYFQRSNPDEKVYHLVAQICDVEYQITRSEIEALMLEYRLIKEHRPWFNSQLKADEKRPYIRIDRSGEYATLSIADDMLHDSAQYLGYFYDEYDARDVLEILNKVWKTPMCEKAAFSRGSRACLYYQTNTCLAPCERKVAPGVYNGAVDEIVSLFTGRRVPAFERLEREMRIFAAGMQYEKAAECKEKLASLERLRRRSRKMLNFPLDQDVIVFLRAYREHGFLLFFVRNGRVVYKKDFFEGFDPAGVEYFSAHAENAYAPLPDSEWMPGCLIEIYADKLFIALPKGSGQEQIKQVVMRGYRAFVYGEEL